MSNTANEDPSEENKDGAEPEAGQDEEKAEEDELSDEALDRASGGIGLLCTVVCTGSSIKPREPVGGTVPTVLPVPGKITR